MNFLYHEIKIYMSLSSYSTLPFYFKTGHFTNGYLTLTPQPLFVIHIFWGVYSLSYVFILVHWLWSAFVLSLFIPLCPLFWLLQINSAEVRICVAWSLWQRGTRVSSFLCPDLTLVETHIRNRFHFMLKTSCLLWFNKWCFTFMRLVIYSNCISM